MNISRRDLLRYATLVVPALSHGCGTVLHPERRGQAAGPLDWRIVALNGLGLVFFFVPGVIAFAVDFATGAIYLPPDAVDDRSERHEIRGQSELLVVDRCDGERVTRSQIEAAIAKHVGHRVDLNDPAVSTRELESLDAFWQVHAEMTADL